MAATAQVVNERTSASMEIAGAVDVLDTTLRQWGRTGDRILLRRLLHDAMATWPGEPREQWWRWLGDVCRGLGLTFRVVDCRFDEFTEAAQDGAAMLTYVDGAESPWCAVCGASARHMLVARSPAGDSAAWRTVRELQDDLGNPGPGAALRCLLVTVPTVDAESAPGHKLKPLQRLWALARPEMRDIYVVLVFALASGILALATPIAVESLVSTVAFGRYLQPIVVLALILLAFLAFFAAMQALQTWVVEIIQRRVFARIVADMSYRLPRVEWVAADGKYLPELTNRFFEIVTVQKVTTKLLLEGVSLILTALVGMAVLAFYHPWLLGFDVVLMALLVGIVFVLGRGAVRTAVEESKWKYRTAAWLEEIGRCSLTFRMDGGADLAQQRADELTCEYLEARRRHFRVLMRQIVFALALQAVASTVLLGLGGWLVISGEMTLGQLVAAELIVTVIVGSFAKLGKHLESYYDLLASVDKLGQVFDLPIENPRGVMHGATEGAAAITLRDAAYRFAGGGGLAGTSFDLQPGEHIAVTGASGSGKSLLIDLVFGLRPPSQGRITIDGVNLGDLRPDVLRRRVALLRDIEVFEGSIAENVHLGRADISSDAVRESLSVAGLLDAVQRLPDGIETRLNAAGAPLSRSQLLRLTLARALAGQPGLLLIDGLFDVLSDQDALDLLNAVESWRPAASVLLTTGRSQLASRCDKTIHLTGSSG